MTVLSLKWAYSCPIANPVEKNILAFLASHNFGGDQSCFRVRTIMSATAYKERAVRDALNSLYRQGYLKKEARYGDKGQQLSNEYTLNIPEEYKQSFYDDYHKSAELSTPPLHSVQPPPALSAPPPLHSVHPLNSNIYNNKENKSSSTISKNTLTQITKTKKNKTQVPLDFKPNEHHYKLANELGVDADYECTKFIDRNRGNGNAQLDWDRTFNNWIRLAHEHAIKYPAKQIQKKSSLMEGSAMAGEQTWSVAAVNSAPCLNDPRHPTYAARKAEEDKWDKLRNQNKKPEPTDEEIRAEILKRRETYLKSKSGNVMDHMPKFG
jgi:hypothetical protein